MLRRAFLYAERAKKAGKIVHWANMPLEGGEIEIGACGSNAWPEVDPSEERYHGQNQPKE
jgi:hypothetical protein